MIDVEFRYLVRKSIFLGENEKVLQTRKRMSVPLGNTGAARMEWTEWEDVPTVDDIP